MKHVAENLRALVEAAENVPLVEIREGKYAGTLDYARSDAAFVEAAQELVAAVEAAAARFCAAVGHLEVVDDSFDSSYEEDGSRIVHQQYCTCCHRTLAVAGGR